jgi:hypothetical protein
MLCILKSSSREIFLLMLRLEKHFFLFLSLCNKKYINICSLPFRMLDNLYPSFYLFFFIALLKILMFQLIVAGMKEYSL